MAEQRSATATIEPAKATTEGVYVYSIVELSDPRTFGKIGIGGRGDEVYTVHFQDLAAVLSQTPLVVYDPTRENALAHEHVNEVLIEAGFTPVPMSFGTLFKTENDALEFLKDTYDALRDVLEKMKDKLEYSLKVNWDRDAVLREIEDTNEDIRRRRASSSRRSTRTCATPKRSASRLPSRGPRHPRRSVRSSRAGSGCPSRPRRAASGWSASRFQAR